MIWYKDVWHQVISRSTWTRSSPKNGAIPLGWMGGWRTFCHPCPNKKTKAVAYNLCRIRSWRHFETTLALLLPPLLLNSISWRNCCHGLLFPAKTLVIYKGWEMLGTRTPSYLWTNSRLSTGRFWQQVRDTKFVRTVPGGSTLLHTQRLEYM